MKVYFIRHAEAQEPGSASDVDRRLTDAGAAQARAAGAALRKLGARVAGILSSPLLRACQTAQEISARLDPSPGVEIRETLAPGAAPRRYFEELGKWSLGGEVAVVGHMPDLARVVAVLLAAEPEISLAFQPSAVCCVEVDLPAETGKLVWFHGPEKLAALAGG
ncbi:MAG TPA: phosphohistidine phosphatase SixA [Planctomycetota bacterium]